MVAAETFPDILSAHSIVANSGFQDGANEPILPPPKLVRTQIAYSEANPLSRQTLPVQVRYLKHNQHLSRPSHANLAISDESGRFARSLPDEAK